MDLGDYSSLACKFPIELRDNAFLDSTGSELELLPLPGLDPRWNVDVDVDDEHTDSVFVEVT